MRVNGETTKLMDKASLFMLMVMFMKVNGSMIKQREKELIHMRMELIMRANGLMISNMDKVLKAGPMVPVMKEITLRGKKRETED